MAVHFDKKWTKKPSKDLNPNATCFGNIYEITPVPSNDTDVREVERPRYLIRAGIHSVTYENE